MVAVVIIMQEATLHTLETEILIHLRTSLTICSSATSQGGEQMFKDHSNNDSSKDNSGDRVKEKK